jgi:hypothetical protein
MLRIAGLSGYGSGGGLKSFGVVLGSNRTNYDLAADLQTGYGWDGLSPVNVSVTVSAGVIVNASSTALPTFAIDLPAGSKVTLINLGSIIGRGGNGGVADSRAGGTALSTTVATSVDNQGMIAGGGGGGGAGLGSGGGGLHAGQNGTQTAAGNGGAGDTCTSGCASVWSGAGGNGGARGAGGGNGSAGDNGGGGSAGAAGKYLAGAGQVTWINIGDVRGPSS